MGKLMDKFLDLTDTIVEIGEKLVFLAEQLDGIEEEIKLLEGEDNEKAVSKPKTSRKREPKTILEIVYGFIKRSRNGATVRQLQEKTKLAPRQISNALHKLAKQGRIEARSRGHYFAAGK